MDYSKTLTRWVLFCLCVSFWQNVQANYYEHDNAPANFGNYEAQANYFGNEGYCCDNSPNYELNTNNCAYSTQFYGNCDPCDGFLDRLLFRADFLYWQASEDGLDLGTLVNRNQVNQSNGTQQLEVSSLCLSDSALDFKYDYGFRLGALYLLPCDGWDTTLNWTWYRDKAKASACGETPTNLPGSIEAIYLNPDWVGGFALPDCGKSDWKLHLNLVDLEFGRKFCLSPRVNLRPHLGLRFIAINQNYNLSTFATNAAIDDDSFITFTNRLNAKSDFWGVGVRTGFDFDFKLGCGFSVVGQAAGSLAYGKFKNTISECTDSTVVTTNEAGIFSSVFDGSLHGSYSYYRSRMLFDFAIGVKWEESFCYNDKYHPFGVALLWEQHAFLRVNQFRSDRILFDFVDNSGTTILHDNHDGDLTTQGLTLSFYFGF